MRFILLLLLVACKGGGGGSGGAPDIEAPAPDPLAQYLWHIDNTGQSNFTSDSGVAGMDINMGDTHNTYQGNSVVIAVSDGRIDLDHEDLKANADISKSVDFLNGASFVLGNPTSTDDTSSHGTTVTGIIGAVKDNGRGGYGIAPKATLVGSNYIEGSQTESRYMKQLSFGDARLYNYSYGGSTCDVNPVADLPLASMEGAVRSYNFIYVTSGGNDYSGSAADCGGSGTYYGNGNLDQIKSYPWLIVVGASSPWGIVSSYSTPSANLWVTAPGGAGVRGIVSTDLIGCGKGAAETGAVNPFDNNSNGLNPNCSYVTGSSIGTSFASPVVTGVVGLLKQANPSMTWRDIKHVLAYTSKKIDPTNTGWITNTAGYEFNSEYGFGQVDVKEAIDLAVTGTFDWAPLKTTTGHGKYSSYESGVINLAIPDNTNPGIQNVINVARHNIILEHVQIRVSINHAYSQDLGIVLTSPSGTTSVATYASSNIVTQNMVDVTFGMNAFYGETSQGNWTLKIADLAAVDVGTLVKWEIKLIGHKVPGSEIVIPTPVTSLTNTGNNFTWSNASPDIARYEICVQTKFVNIYFTCDEEDWGDIGAATSGTITKNSWGSGFSSGALQKLYIRAVDTSENVSSVVEREWAAP